MPAPKSDDLIQDYISDVWGTGEAVRKTEPQVIDEEPEVISTLSQASAHTNRTLDRRYSLVPTLKYQTASDVSLLRDQTDLLILLLCNLYLLRRPLSPKVRQFILTSSEQLIDDFNAAFWLKQLSKKGAFSEV